MFLGINQLKQLSENRKEVTCVLVGLSHSPRSARNVTGEFPVELGTWNLD
jgi:hypothetical protein